MAPHGPDAATHERASKAELRPTRIDGGMAFLIESSMMLGLSEWAANTRQGDHNATTWKGLESHFKIPAGAVVKSPLLEGASNGVLVEKVNGDAAAKDVVAKDLALKEVVNGHPAPNEETLDGRETQVAVTVSDRESVEVNGGPQ